MQISQPFEGALHLELFSAKGDSIKLPLMTISEDHPSFRSVRSCCTDTFICSIELSQGVHISVLVA
jgi:hypothetical protein